MIRKQGLTPKHEEYRVISVDIITDGIQMWGTFTNLDDALTQAQNIKHHGIDVYVHGDSNRVISKV
jgi:hypothetical protein